MRVRNHPELPSILQQRFTNRERHITVFLRHMESVSAPLPALMFYGMGGIGKSWLLRRLRDELRGRYDTPSVLIDFTLEQGSNPYGSDPLLFLAELRRITDAPCPRFDVALTLAMVRRYRLDESALTDKWKTTGASAGWEVVKATGGAVHPVLGGALSVLERGYGAIKDHAFLSAVRERFIADLEDLRYKDLQDIERQLTWRLTQDLLDESALPLRQGHRVARAVVLVDTIESLLPAGMSESDEERQSARLRELIVELRDRVLFVLAGQNRLDWSFLDPEWEDPKWLDQHPLDGLAEPDARKFLSLCGLDTEDVQNAVFDKCLRVEDGKGYHAASLGLFADIGWIEIHRNGRKPTPALYDEVDRGDMASLMRRFLKSLPVEVEQQWIRRLAVTPLFDEEAARAMHSDGWSQTQDTAVEVLRGLSFLVLDPSKPGWFAVHSAVQDALRLSGQVERSWHERWRCYWNGRREEGLAWFHFWSLDRQQARVAWEEQAEKLRSSLAMSRQDAMLDWWKPTGIEQRRPSDREDGAALESLGRELRRASLLDPAIHLPRAIACYKRALEVYTREKFEVDWARTQNNLGLAYADLPEGDRTVNLRNAITCYEQALEVYTRRALLAEWAGAQNNLGNAYTNLPNGNLSANLRSAIACYERALEVYMREALPAEWEITQKNLGLVYMHLPDGDRGDNLRNAIARFKDALGAHARAKDAVAWAMTQHSLGLAYAHLPDGDPADNLRNAIVCYRRALEVYTREAFPVDWAVTQHNLGLAYVHLPDGDLGANLRNAIVCFQRTLEVRTRGSFPVDWAKTLDALGVAHAQRPDGDRADNLRNAITCFELELEVYTPEAFPTHWAMTQFNIALAVEQLAELDSAHRHAHLSEAASRLREALLVFTETGHEHYAARSRESLVRIEEKLG